MEAKKESRSKAEREEFVLAWRASGKSVTAFAAEHGLPSSSLYKWIRPPMKRREMGQRVAARRATKPSPNAGFAKVNMIGNAGARSRTLTVALRSGDTVTFQGPPVDVAQLAAVLKVVRAC